MFETRELFEYGKKRVRRYVDTQSHSNVAELQHGHRELLGLERCTGLGSFERIFST